MKVETKIINFGSLNIDTVYLTDHIAAPGETISAYGIKSFCGGKGLNQSVALSNAGVEVYHFGKIGSDGKALENVLLEHGVDCRYLIESPERSGNALIQTARNGENSIILFSGANKEFTEAEAERVIDAFAAGDILVTQNETNLVEYIIEGAYKKGLHVVLNPSPVDEIIKKLDLNKVTWLVINEVEGFQLTGKKEPEDIIGNLLEKYKGLKVVLTLGKEGSIYGDRTQTCRQQAYNVEAVDTTGAGDTFLGYFIGMVSNGADVKTAMDTASAASALTVKTLGATNSIPKLRDVISFMEEFK